MLTVSFCIKVKIITQEVISWMGLAFQNVVFPYVLLAGSSCHAETQHLALSLNFVPTEGSRKISNYCSEFWVGIWSNILWYFFITNGKYMIWFSSLCEGWWMGKREQTAFCFWISLESFRFRVSWSPWDVHSSWTHLQSVFQDFFSHTIISCSLWLFSSWQTGAGTWTVKHEFY